MLVKQETYRNGYNDIELEEVETYLNECDIYYIEWQAVEKYLNIDGMHASIELSTERKKLNKFDAFTSVKLVRNNKKRGDLAVDTVCTTSFAKEAINAFLIDLECMINVLKE